MLPFVHPFTCIVSGPTGSGKTDFVMRVIDNADALIEPTPAKIVYYFGEYQPLFDRYAGVDFRHGMPKAGEIDKLADALVVFDDMMADIDERVTNVLQLSRADRTIETFRRF